MYRLPSGALWMLVFTAVLGHLPGLAFDLARHDFEGLARAAGLDPTGAWSPRAWTDLAVWSVWWRIGGTDPSVPHGFSVLLVALDALLVALVAARLGIPRAGAILASALWLMGAQTGLAVASATAAADLWALGFALGGLLLWLGEHWLDYDLKIIIPALLILLLNGALLAEIKSAYSGYNRGFVLVGVVWLLLTVGAAFVLEYFSKKKGNNI